MRRGRSACGGLPERDGARERQADPIPGAAAGVHRIALRCGWVGGAYEARARGPHGLLRAHGRSSGDAPAGRRVCGSARALRLRRRASCERVSPGDASVAMASPTGETMASNKKQTGGAPATGDVMTGEKMISRVQKLEMDCSSCGLLRKAANNPWAGMRVFPQVRIEFVLSGKKPGTNSVQIKRDENGAFWIVLNVFVASNYSPIFRHFKYRDLYQRAVA